MRPVEILKANGEEVELYIDIKPFAFRKSIMFIPIKGLVDRFSIKVVERIVADHDAVQLTDVNKLNSDLHGIKAFTINLEGDTADYYEANRENRGTEVEYALAKQKLVNVVSKFFEAEKLFAEDILNKLNNR